MYSNSSEPTFSLYLVHLTCFFWGGEGSIFLKSKRTVSQTKPDSSHSLSLYCHIPTQGSMTYIKKFSALVARADCHVTVTTDIFINTTARLLKENKGSRARGGGGEHNSLRERERERDKGGFGLWKVFPSPQPCGPKRCDNLI